MRVSEVVVTALVLGSLLSGCATQPASEFRSGDAEKAIANGDATLTAAVRNRDVAAIAALYGESAILMPPDRAAVTGREAIRQFWSGMLAAGRVEIKTTSIDVLQSGDLAAESGRYEATITPPNGAAMHDGGSYVTVWQKQNGHWLVVRDIFTSTASR